MFKPLKSASVAPSSALILLLAMLWAARADGGNESDSTSDLSAVASSSDVASPPATPSEMAARVDSLLSELWRQRGVQPNREATPLEFLRRVSLDLTGVVPTVAEAREFAESAAEPGFDLAAARSKWIERYLASPRHATHLANTWRNMLLPDGFSAEMGGGILGMQAWLRSKFAENVRYDRFVGEFLTASGTAESGPALYYQALEADPAKLASSTSRIFLGLQLDCAQCHDHPYDAWSQEDFWQYAAFFAQVRGSVRGGTFDLQDEHRGDVTLPEEDQPIGPEFPNGESPSVASGSRRVQLSIWMASAGNPFLARATVNRVWALLFGRGLVNPVDNLSPDNDPVHPELLDELSVYFVRSGYDLRSLFRVLANTRVYRLSSRSVQTLDAAARKSAGEDAAKDADEQSSELRRLLFAQAEVRALTAEQLFDSIYQALHQPMSGKSSHIVDNPGRQSFIAQIGARTEDATEYGAGIQQTLNLMNGDYLAVGTTTEQLGILAAIKSPLFSDIDRVETVFLASVSRTPTQGELAGLLGESWEKDGELTTQQLGDLLWALINSAEFRFNH